MADNIDVKINQEELQAILDVLDPKQAVKSHVLVLNKLAGRGRKDIRERFKAEYNFKGKVRAVIRRARMSDLSAFISGRRSPYSLGRFNPSQTRLDPGTFVEVKKGMRVMIPHAFLAPVKGAPMPLVFKRAGKARLPILDRPLNQEYSVSLGSFIASPETVQSINTMIETQGPDLLRQTLDDQLHRRVSKLGIDVDDEPGDE